MTCDGRGCVPDVSHPAYRVTEQLQPSGPMRTLTCANVLEPVTGIEPACPAWEAGALPLSYTGKRPHRRGRGGEFNPTWQPCWRPHPRLLPRTAWPRTPSPHALPALPPPP